MPRRIGGPDRQNPDAAALFASIGDREISMVLADTDIAAPAGDQGG